MQKTSLSLAAYDHTFNYLNKFQHKKLLYSKYLAMSSARAIFPLYQ